MSTRKELATIGECETCRFWCTDGEAGDGDVLQDGNEGGNAGNSGECRIRAPSLILAMDQHRLREGYTIRGNGPDAGKLAEMPPCASSRAVWPITYAWNWCGEWKPAATNAADDTADDGGSVVPPEVSSPTPHPDVIQFKRVDTFFDENDERYKRCHVGEWMTLRRNQLVWSYKRSTVQYSLMNQYRRFLAQWMNCNGDFCPSVDDMYRLMNEAPDDEAILRHLLASNLLSPKSAAFVSGVLGTTVDTPAGGVG